MSFLKQVINDDRLRSRIKDHYIDIAGIGFGDVEVKIMFKDKKRPKEVDEK